MHDSRLLNCSCDLVLYVLLLGKKTVGDFPCHNWLIIYGLLLGLNYTVFIMFTPSIYQFVTAAKSSEESEVTFESWEVG